jgi:hypothetical protein
LVILLSLFAIVGCDLVPTPEPRLPPTQVVDAFYRWYVGYPGNPMVDRSYRDSPYLADSFIDEVDTLLASMERGGADPFLLAQDIPDRYAVTDAQVDGNQATAILSLYWPGNETPSLRTVELRRDARRWQITGVYLVDVVSPDP